MQKQCLSKIIVAICILVSLAACSDGIQQPNIQGYRLSYNGNGNDGGTPPAPVQASPGDRIIVGVNSGYMVKDKCYFSGWNTRSDGGGTSFMPGASLFLESDMALYAQWRPDSEVSKTFYAVTTSETWYRVDTKKLAENEVCIVYGDINSTISLQAAAAMAIAGEYKEKIHKQITAVFGDINYMPANNGKLFLLLLDIIDGYEQSGGYVAGYFDSTHMYQT
ncbi:MAG: InlB B-repeat-containing protein, partial [Spirochaetaceae bacterium]|nr:InlB B-repeat-containing protein [Spirochaetaceae bacterium]